MENKDKKPKINEQAEFCVAIAEGKIALEKMKDTAPLAIGVLKIMYDEAVEQGFNVNQAFEFATKYVIASSFKSN
jgi:hypothetical protein